MAAPKGNSYAVGHGYGRPALYTSVEQLAERITAYFEYCQGEFEDQTKLVKRKRKDPDTGRMKMVEVEEVVTICLREPERPMVTGLALFLGFESRQSLKDYAKKQDFSYPLKRALMVIEKEYEDMLPYAKGGGVVFALKNMGWEDKSTVDNNVNLKGKPGWLGVAASKKANASES